MLLLTTIVLKYSSLFQKRGMEKMPIYEFEGKRPKIGAGTFVHPDAVVLGDVVIGEDCYIGPGAVLRADWGWIRVGDGSNIQENCVLHAGPERGVLLEGDCHIGHGAILHDARLARHVTVGMGAIVQDGASVGEGSIVGAGCVVLANSEIPGGKIVVGIPGEVKGDVSDKRAAAAWAGTRLYQELPARYFKGFKRVDQES